MEYLHASGDLVAANKSIYTRLVPRQFFEHTDEPDSAYQYTKLDQACRRFSNSMVKIIQICSGIPLNFSIWYNRVPRGVLLFSASDLQFPGTPLMIYITVKSAGKIVTTPTSLLLEYDFLTDPRLEVSNAKGGDPKLGSLGNMS